MLFNSLHYILFFPLVVWIFFTLPPGRGRLLWLLAASCYFYMVFVPVYILILAALIVVDYVAGLAIAGASTQERRKAYLAISLVANIGGLAFFKYYNFLAENLNTLSTTVSGSAPLPHLSIFLPIGLSFHTFQAMSYTIEVYRGRQRAERNLGTYALFVMFFPQLVAGPIERPQNLFPQYHATQRFSREGAVMGLRIMLWGFFKKVVIADRLALVVDHVFAYPEGQGALAYLVATLFFSIQIYCDFSGYSDIAIGSARILGFKLMQNFDTPYLATSLTEFWRRWHISLSTWFRDYVYLPLGGNRAGELRRLGNLMTVFLVSGLWHGANWTFVVWGAIHGLGLVVERILRVEVIPRGRIRRLIGAMLTFSLTTIAWVFFRASNLGEAVRVLQVITVGLPSVPFQTSSLWELELATQVGLGGSFLLIATLALVEFRFGAFPLQSFAERVSSRGLRRLTYALIALSLFFADSQAQTFIYFQF